MFGLNGLCLVENEILQQTSKENQFFSKEGVVPEQSVAETGTAGCMVNFGPRDLISYTRESLLCIPH